MSAIVLPSMIRVLRPAMAEKADRPILPRRN